MKIYVASSWRNDYQPDVVAALRELEHEVYDFRNPFPGNEGFSWKEIDGGWQSWSNERFIAALEHPIAVDGFSLDYNAMQQADACVLVMPCGRSAHLEAGYFVGANKPLLILLDDKQSEPELMYKLADGIFTGLGELLLFLQEVEDDLLAKTCFE